MTLTIKSVIIVTLTLGALCGGYLWLQPIGPRSSDHIFEQYNPGYAPRGEALPAPGARKE